jgi:hypothetical protein
MEKYNRIITPSSSKAEFIPAEYKVDIDKNLVDDYMQANRYYAENNPELSSRIESIAQLSPEFFYSGLVDAWKNHHNFFEATLQPEMELMGQPTNPSEDELVALAEAYKKTIKVDADTLVFSAAIKSHINMHANNIASKYGIDSNKFIMDYLQVESFFVYFDRRSLSHLVDAENSTTAEFEEYVNEFHGQDLEIALGRLALVREKYSFLELSEALSMLDREIQTPTKPEWISEEDWGHVMFLRQTLAFDNMEEYMISYNLEGFSGYLLRKWITSLLVNNRILDIREGIYAYDDVEIIEGLETMRNLQNKEIKPKRQYGLTCTAACAAMVEAFSREVEPTDEIERLYDKAATSKFTDGQHYSKIASLLAERGVSVELRHELEGRFRQGELPKRLFDQLMEEYLEGIDACKKAGVKETNGGIIDSKTVENILREGKVIILAGQLQSGLYHSVLIVGMKNSKFRLIDPLYGSYRTWRSREVEKFSTTDIGKWLLATDVQAQGGN